jgi:hypothetical protein
VSYYADWMQPKTLVLDNDFFDLSVAPGAVAIDMTGFPTASDLNIETTNLIQADLVFVRNYNGVAGDNFQVFYPEQAANYVVPVSVVSQFDPTVHRIVGAPIAGLTNQECWAEYGIAIAGAVAPSTATTRNGINGLVNPI